MKPHPHLHQASAGDEAGGPLAPVLDRNIRALLERRRKKEQEEGAAASAAGWLAARIGTLGAVYFHLILFGIWILINLGWTPLRKFDGNFEGLARVASVEAIFISLLVLARQNRAQQLAEKRSELTLHISLLDEAETTRIIRLLAAVADKTGAGEAIDAETRELMKDVKPERVIAELERSGTTKLPKDRSQS